MSRSFERTRTLTRRAVIFGGLNLTAFTALAGRLYYLQLIKADEYATLSENNRIKLVPIVPERGHLLDRNGLTMAANEKNFRLVFDVADSTAAEGKPQIIRACELVGVGPKRQAQLLASAKFNRAAPPLVLKENLTWDELARVEINLVDLPGVSIETGQVRNYPYAEHSAHLIGYVGAVSQQEMEDGEEEALMRMNDFKIGKSGVEKLLDKRLRGVAGVRKVEVNVHGAAVRESIGHASEAGENIHLTIDARLQEAAIEALGEESGAVVMMDVTNGDVLSLVSMPGFDPNAFSKGIASDYWKELNANIRNPLLNKAISGQYPPGSTFKMLVGLAGLQAGVVDAGTRVFCPGHFFLGDHQFNCWKEEGHGSVNLKEAIAESCDTYFYTVAQRVGIQPIAQMARIFGLGDLTGIELFSEKKAIVPDPEWKKKRYNQRWQAGDTINVGIGQGYVLSTPVQLAVMTARLATGQAVVPRLVADGPTKFAPLKVDMEHLKHVQEGMEAAVNSPYGTAYRRRIIEPRHTMAGKTGTSQVRRILQRGMNQSLLPWEARHHALFVGYAPVDNPRYCCAVLVEHGGGGASAAAPVAHDLLKKVQELADERKNT